MSEPWRRRVRAASLRGLSWATGSALDPLVRGALWLATHALRPTRAGAVTRANLELALGRERSAHELATLASAVRVHTARLAHEWLFMAQAARGPAQRARVERWIDSAVEFDPSVDELRARAALGRGVLVISAHLGNWELLAAALRRVGLDGAVVGLRKPNDSGAQWLVELRAGLGVRSIAQDAAPRDVLRVLREGATLGLVCDLHARRLDSVDAPLFGVLAPTMTAPAALARASGLPLTPARCVRIGERYRISVEPPLELAQQLPRAAAQLDLLTRMNAVFERWIRQTPEQWAWHQRRWPGVPPRR